RAGDDGLFALEHVVAVENERTAGCAGDIDDLDAFDGLRAESFTVDDVDLGVAGGAAPHHEPIRGRVVSGKDRLDLERAAVADIIAGDSERADAAARRNHAAIGYSADLSGAFQTSCFRDRDPAAKHAAHGKRTTGNRGGSGISSVVSGDHERACP